MGSVYCKAIPIKLYSLVPHSMADEHKYHVSYHPVKYSAAKSPAHSHGRRHGVSSYTTRVQDHKE